MPVYAGAQSPERIVVSRDLGDYERGDYLGIHGQITAQTSGSFIVIQVTNPRGELCNIQQMTPLSSGSFVGKGIALLGPLCGINGDYGVRIFYDEYRASSSFAVLPSTVATQDDEQRFENATSVLDKRIEQTLSIETSAYESRARSITYPSGTVVDLSVVYADLLDASFSDRTLDGLDVNLRRATTGALDAIDSLEDAMTIGDTTATSIRKLVYSAIYYYELGDKRMSAEQMNAAYGAINTADPASGEAEQPVTFASLRNTLLSLIQKSNEVLSSELRNELAFILARGTAPVYADELRAILDILTQARYLEITSNKTDPLYTFVAREWGLISPSLKSTSSIESFVGFEDRVQGVYDAAFVLRDLDKVSRFIESGENGGLAELLRPEWNSLQSTLRSANDVDDILAQQDAIEEMRQVTEISSRLEQVITITRANRISNDLTSAWPGLLMRVSDASSLSEIREIVDEFDRSISAMRDARNPIEELKLEYRELLAKAEQRSDRTAIANIENAQRVLELAERISSGAPTQTKLDRIEVLLVWVVQQVDVLTERLASFTPEENKRRSANILERAQTLENLAELGLRTKRFVPGYTDYVDEVLKTVERVRALVIGGELRSADDLVRRATTDWREIDEAYREEPASSDFYGKVDIQQREYQKHADDLHDTAKRLLVAGTTESREFTRLISMVDEFIEHGNFVEAHDAITAAYEYARDNLSIEHRSIIYEIDHRPDIRAWILEGYVDKQSFDNREDITVFVRTADGEIYDQLDFTDTKHGRFHVQFDAPEDPGVYVAELTWRNKTSVNIVYIPYPEPSNEDRQVLISDSGGVELIAISQDLYDLQEFMQGFGGSQYQAHVGKITPLIAEAEDAVRDRDKSLARAKVVEIRELIERYLPLRSPEGVIRATYATGNLNIAGALYKMIEFPEDIYVDIFDQTGQLEATVRLTDDPDGMFSRDVLRSFEPGTYVATLSYHDLRVSDFFTVR